MENYISLIVERAEGQWSFPIHIRQPLKHLMTNYAETYGFDLDDLEFYAYEGRRLETFDTALFLGLCDGEVITAHYIRDEGL